MGEKMYSKLILFSIVLSFILGGCNSNETLSTLEKARIFCNEKNGTVKIEELNENNTTEVCKTTEIGIFDEGTEKYNFSCDLLDFYAGNCEKIGEEEVTSNTLLESNKDKICSDDTSQHCAYYNMVDNILLHLVNTGYIHRPFLLDPDIGEINSKKNLFLDCSGFVGYYILQQLTPKLYNVLPRKYSCGPLKDEKYTTTAVARPLAADFVDYIKSLSVTVKDNNDAEIDDKQCWGRVEHIRDALPGDVIAYTHNGNIDTNTKYCCFKKDTSFYTENIKIESYKYVTRKMSNDDNCSNGRIIYKTKLDKNHSHKSTGHVMFIMKKPYLSTKCKDNGQCKYHMLHPFANYQWVVYVGDSTNVKHTSDSRIVENDGGSKYKNHSYHAWTEGVVEECVDGSYHRNCSKHNTTKENSITVKGSSKSNHPTGIGAGYIYVNDAMDGYRTKYSADISDAKIVIARPVRCK
jgi:hypothetical protein